MPRNPNDFRPLPDYLTVKASELHGLGLFATRDIPSDLNIGITHIADERFPHGYIRTPIGGFINYSSDPNCQFLEEDDTFSLKTLRPINKYEELTADYRSWYDEATLSSFNQ